MSDLSALGHVHFLGLAGVGVSAVARLMHASGVSISGTDGKELPVLEEFRAAGVPVRVGYSAANLESIEAESGDRIQTVVASSVATAGNPEYDAAADAGATLLHRSQGLAACMAGQQAVAVAGTHGKTTTSSMAAVMLEAAGLKPSFAIGATVSGLGTNAALGEGDWFVAEADESDGSLLNYTPQTAVITNVEPDHLDHYGTAEAVEKVFMDFCDRIVDGGSLVICADDDGSRALLGRVKEKLRTRRITVVTYGQSTEADLRVAALAPEGSGQLVTFGYQGVYADTQLAVPGLHNALNAAAAVGVGVRAGLDIQTAAEALSRFAGSSRRFELRGEVNGVRVYDDYAHHPTEVAAVLSAARTAAGAGKVHAVFQPHLFSRTQAFAGEFGDALNGADSALVLEIYPAREKPLPGVTAELLGHPVHSGESAVQRLAEIAEPGDLVLTIGAGDVTYLGQGIVTALQQRSV